MSFDHDLPNGWRWSTLDEVKAPGRSVVSGPFGSNIGKRFFVEVGVPVIRGNNLTTGMNRFHDGGFVYLTDEKAKEFTSCEAVVDDLIFTAAGTIGQVGLIPRKSRYSKYIISNKQLRARLNTDMMDPVFAYYWFASPPMVQAIQSRNTGSTIPLINLSVLKSLPVVVPPMNEQRAIAANLSLLDDRITLLRETNATLESIAQALFKSWFVDFNPVRDKMEGRAPEGMDEDTAGLFPDRFEESEVGLVPKGWQLKPLQSISTVTMGLSPKGDSYNVDGVGVPLINGPVEFGEYFPVRAKWTSASDRVAKAGDLIFCVRGSTTGRRVISDGEYCIGRGVCSIRAYNEHHAFLYQTINFGLNRLLSKTTGSVFPSISAPDIKGFEVLVPPNDVIDAFEHCAGALLQRTQSNQRQIQTLTALRDTLLPRLISGQLRLPEAIEALEAA